MNTTTSREHEPWWLDTRLLALDPDVAALFADVEDILRQARTPHALVAQADSESRAPARRQRPRVRSAEFSRAAAPVAAGHRARPARHRPQPDRTSWMRPSSESEVMPVSNTARTPPRAGRCQF